MKFAFGNLHGKAALRIYPVLEFDTGFEAMSFEAAFAEFVSAEEYPCVGAKSALAHAKIVFFEGEAIDRSLDDFPLYDALVSFGESLEQDPKVLQSFVAGFNGPRQLSEKQFERALFDRLQALHNMDAARGQEWSADVSSDPESPHFSMSVAGTAYFVIGLHPNASRKARQFKYPTLVFNSSEQFEALRDDGTFEKMQEVVRERDTRLDGGINPMLDDYGDAPETRQYSGRELPDDWECPISVQKVNS